MPSTDFEIEKKRFRNYYDKSLRLFKDAENSLEVLVSTLVTHSGNITFSKIEGRIKSKEECIRKFNRKYRTELESNNTPYAIKDHISDLIGIRIVCLYEDDIDNVSDLLTAHFDVIEVTDKIALLENTEGSFGYKGLHLNLKLGKTRRNLPEYEKFSNLSFEVQIRTVIQDSWSVLDHKIKYKKSIPNRLKRRINTLAALFELADREFREIRDATEEEIRKAEEAPDDSVQESDTESERTGSRPRTPSNLLDAFSFLRIARHFCKEHDFKPRKVDGFTQEILKLAPKTTRGDFNNYMRENIGIIKRYLSERNGAADVDKLESFTIIRHCLYLGDPKVFRKMLTNIDRNGFDAWQANNG